jgi:hypothetical protein
MGTYRVVQASRTEGLEKRVGWVVETQHSRLGPYAVSVLFATSDGAAAEAERLTALDAKSSNEPFLRCR